MLILHLRNLFISYVVAVAASAITLSVLATTILLFDPTYDAKATLPFAAILSLIWFGMAALLFVAPAIIVAYPIAILVSRRLIKPLHTAIAGACMGPVLGSAATLVAMRLLDDGPSYNSWLNQMAFLAPAAAVSGGAIGWTVAKLDRIKA